MALIWPDILPDILAVLCGGLIGLSLGATGGGGSLVAIPLLVYIVGVTVQEATAISLLLVGASALIGVFEHYKAGEVHVNAALAFSLAGTLAAWAGAQGHRFVREDVILFLFALLMLVAAVRMVVHAGLGAKIVFPGDGTSRLSAFDWGKVGGLGVVVGLLAGFFGVGGGFLIVPALVLVLKFPLRLAIGTALLIIFLVSLGGLVGHLQLGAFNLRLAGLLLVGSAVGMVLGTRLGRAVSEPVLTRTFATLVAGIAVWLLIDHGLPAIGSA